VLKWSDDHTGARERLEQALALRPTDPLIQKELSDLDQRLKPSVQLNGLYFEDNAHRRYYSLGPSAQFPLSDRLTLTAIYKYLDFDQVLGRNPRDLRLRGEHFAATGNQFEGQIHYELGPRSWLSATAGVADFSTQDSSRSSRSGQTVPMGSVKWKTAVGDTLDLSIAADHTYVNTAGAIAKGLAFSRVTGTFGVKLSDTLRLDANHAFYEYTDENQRNRTELNLTAQLLRSPEFTVGAQFIHDHAENRSDLFWTPNHYLGIAVPLALRTKLTDSLVADLQIAPGAGKETGGDFKFQLNSSARLQWNVNEDLNLFVAFGKYQAATYSNFSTFAGVSLRF
jgi:hypothetical protein